MKASDAITNYSAAVEVTKQLMAEKIENLELENERLRQIVSKCAESLGTSAFISPTCTVDFMSGLPNEISSTVKGLRKALADVVKDLEIRSKNGVVDCSHGVYSTARALSSTGDTHGN